MFTKNRKYSKRRLRKTCKNHSRSCKRKCRVCHKKHMRGG